MLERLDSLRRPWGELPQATKEAIIARVRDNRYGSTIHIGQHRDLQLEEKDNESKVEMAIRGNS